MNKPLISGHAEAKLTSLSNREDGGIRMGFVIQPDDVTDALRRARPGTFFMLGYQQFDPDAREAPEPDKPAPEKRRERKLSERLDWYARRPEFWPVLRDLGHYADSYDEAVAAQRIFCRVHSRSECDVPGSCAEDNARALLDRYETFEAEQKWADNLARGA